jgi:hypothetical protein
MPHEWKRDLIRNVTVWRCNKCDAMTLFSEDAKPESKSRVRAVSLNLKPGLLYSCDEIIALTIQGS